MISAPIPKNENARLKVLDEYHILDTEKEQELDELTKLASIICEVPVSLITLIDNNRQWFKSKVGTNIDETPRDVSFCAHAIDVDSPIFEVKDTAKDLRFADNPLVTGDSKIQFYAGAKLQTEEGYALGTICVIDTKPRELSKNQKDALETLAKQVMLFLNLKRDNKKVNELSNELNIILKNTEDLIYELDINGDFIFSNSNGRNFFGLKKRELIGRNFFELVDRSFRSALEFDFLRLTKGGIKKTKNKFQVTNKKGKKRWISQTLNIIHTADKDIRIVAVARDTTKDKKAETELQTLSIVAQQTSNIVLILNKEFNIEWINKSFTNVFGYSFKEVKGKNPADLLNGPKTDLKITEKIESKLLKGKAAHFELINYDKAGEEKWIEILMNPIYDNNGQICNYIAMEQDITERKLKQELIKTQNKELINSMEYATRIQKAALPSDNYRKELDCKTEIIYLPKDIVSGDFYLADRVYTSKNDYIEVLVVADCTGHGVPGAMLSLLCSNLLTEAINDIKVQSSGDALDYTKRRLEDFLQIKDQNKLYDGMDVAFCAVDKKNKLVHFSGANRPLYIFRNNELIIIKGDRQSVGYSRTHEPFKSHEIEFKEGDIYYLFSDGYADQFGGERQRKFMSKRLKELITEVGNKDIDQQKDILTRAVVQWKGENEQTDDICLMIIKL